MNHKLKYNSFISHIIETLVPSANKTKTMPMKRTPLFKSVQDANFREFSIHDAVTITNTIEEKAIMAEAKNKQKGSADASLTKKRAPKCKVKTCTSTSSKRQKMNALFPAYSPPILNLKSAHPPSNVNIIM